MLPDGSGDGDLGEEQIQNRRTDKQTSDGDCGVEQAFFKAALGTEDIAFSAKSSTQTRPALLEQDGYAQEHRKGDHGDGKNG